MFRDRPPRGGGRTALAIAGLALAVTLGGCMGFEHEEVTRPDEFAREYWADSSIPAAVAPDPAPAGKLLVVVVDASERPIANAAIQLSIDGSHFTGSTSTQGDRHFEDLEPGNYEVEVVAGFAESERWIRVRAGTESTVTFRLDPAKAEEPEYILLEGAVDDDVPSSSRRTRLLRLEAQAQALANEE